MSEAGGKHYGDGLQPWDLQKCMPSSGNAFIDARRADAIKYSFRLKGDKIKLLDDLKKSRHCLDAAINLLEKTAKFEESVKTKTFIIHPSHDRLAGNRATCLKCNCDIPDLVNPCIKAIPENHPAYKPVISVHHSHKYSLELDKCSTCGKSGESLAEACI